MSEEQTITAEILRQVEARGEGKSICPSEVARSLAPEAWRPLMSAVRRAAIKLSQANQIDILRKGHVVQAGEIRGVIRLRVHSPVPVIDEPQESG